MRKNRKPAHGGNRGRAVREKVTMEDTNPKSKNITSTKNRQGICGLLLRGESNAITAAELARITGQTPREVTRAIQRARLAGKPICASGTGFFLASDSRELARYVRGLDRRLGEIRRTREALGDVLAAATGQTCVEG